MAAVSLHVWNARDRDWAARKYASKLAFRVMQNYMFRQHRSKAAAIRKKITTEQGRAQ